jgi:hypothetical protein
MTSKHYYGISLRVSGGSVDPDQVSELLEQAPEYWSRKGEKKQSKSSIPIIPNQHYWSFSFEGASIGDQIDNVFLFLEKKDSALRKIMAAEARLSIYVFVSPIGSLGFELEPAQLGLLSSLNIAFGIEAHCPRPAEP